MKKCQLTLFLFLSLCLFFPMSASANSAEPPSFTVIVVHAPENLSLALQIDEDATVQPVALRREKKAWETYYRFFYHAYPGGAELAKGATLLVHGGGEPFSCQLPWDSFRQYNNIVTLDLDTHTITSGQPPFRIPALVALRVVLTLLIEGVVFWLFRYRSKKSWIAFFLINLTTQGALNALLTGPTIGSYWMFGFFLLEAIIFAVEMLFFGLAVREQGKRRALVTAFTANAASLLLGGALIFYLPI